MSDVNSLELMLIQEDLQKIGVTEFTARKGNNCVWVSYGLVNCYYIFNNGQVVDVQVD